MSDTHLYLSLIPEALIASMLEPQEFGTYYAVGSKVHGHGDEIFFEVDPDFRSADFPFHLIRERCITQPDGAPKRSVYLGIHEVLTRIPVSALGNLYLVTNDGKTLELQRSEYQPQPSGRLYLYQEFCPITPIVASKLEPHEFCASITRSDSPVHVPRIVFSELRLGELATDPEKGNGDDLPYPHLTHIRDQLAELSRSTTKPNKLVLRQARSGVLYRMVEQGFYVGDQNDFAFYRFPDAAALENEHRGWWRSAQVTWLD